MTTTDKRKVLGRGLETLLPSRQVPHAPVAARRRSQVRRRRGPPHPAGPARPQSLSDAHLSLDPVALKELAASIKAVGVVQPIVVRPVAGGRYQVIAGERRWEASRSLGLPTIPAIVRQVSNEQAMEMTIIENLQREDLNAMEQARAFDRLSREFGLTQEQMSLRTGKERSSIANFLRLLKLPPSVQDHGGAATSSASAMPRSMMPLESPEQIERLARRMVEHGLSVRQTEEAVTHLVEPLVPKTAKQRIVDPNVNEAENTLQEALGVRVTIDDRKGKGKILIEYSSLEDFDRIIEALGGKKTD